MNKKTLHRFRMIGIAEGISFLVLLLIAMPLKYFLNFLQAVKYVGWLHGALFVAYIYFALTVFTVLKKSFNAIIIHKLMILLVLILPSCPLQSLLL